jgi:hypothetical protein
MAMVVSAGPLLSQLRNCDINRFTLGATRAARAVEEKVREARSCLETWNRL